MPFIILEKDLSDDIHDINNIYGFDYGSNYGSNYCPNTVTQYQIENIFCGLCNSGDDHCDDNCDDDFISMEIGIIYEIEFINLDCTKFTISARYPLSDFSTYDYFLAGENNPTTNSLASLERWSIHIIDDKLVKYLISIGFKYSTFSLQHFIYINNQELIELLLENEVKPSSDCIVYAVINDNESLIKRFAEMSEYYLNFTLSMVAYYGKQKYIDYLVDCGADVKLNHYQCIKEILAHNQFDTFKYLFTKIDILEYLETPYSSNILYEAYNRDLMPFVEFLTEIGSKIHVFPMGIVRRDNVKLLQYLIEHQSEFNKHITQYVYDIKSLAMLKYFIEQGLDIHQNNDILLLISIGSKNYEMVEYLLDSGIDIHKNCEMIEYLLDNGIDVHNNAWLTIAIHKHDLPMVKLLGKHGANILDPEIIKYAVEKKCFAIVKYLQDCGAVYENSS